MKNKKQQHKRDIIGGKSSVNVWKFGGFCALFLIIFTVLENVVRNSNVLLPICVPWMYDYEGILVVSILLALIKKYLCKAKKDFAVVWIMFFLKSVVVIVIIPAIIFLTNGYLENQDVLKCYGTVVDMESASVVPTKSASPLRNYVRIKLNNENTSFWYDIHKESKQIGTKCVLVVKRGFWGLRYVDKVGFLVK